MQEDGDTAQAAEVLWDAIMVMGNVIPIGATKFIVKGGRALWTSDGGAAIAQPALSYSFQYIGDYSHQFLLYQCCYQWCRCSSKLYRFGSAK